LVHSARKAEYQKSIGDPVKKAVPPSKYKKKGKNEATVCKRSSEKDWGGGEDQAPEGGERVG